MILCLCVLSVFFIILEVLRRCLLLPPLLSGKAQVEEGGGRLPIYSFAVIQRNEPRTSWMWAKCRKYCSNVFVCLCVCYFFMVILVLIVCVALCLPIYLYRSVYVFVYWFVCQTYLNVIFFLSNLWTHLKSQLCHLLLPFSPLVFHFLLFLSLLPFPANYLILSVNRF